MARKPNPRPKAVYAGVLARPIPWPGPVRLPLAIQARLTEGLVGNPAFQNFSAECHAAWQQITREQFKKLNALREFLGISLHDGQIDEAVLLAMVFRLAEQLVPGFTMGWPTSKRGRHKEWSAAVLNRLREHVDEIKSGNSKFTDARAIGILLKRAKDGSAEYRHYLTGKHGNDSTRIRQLQNYLSQARSTPVNKALLDSIFDQVGKADPVLIDALRKMHLPIYIGTKRS